MQTVKHFLFGATAALVLLATATLWVYSSFKVLGVI